jgi:HlyD family secretion protein
MKMQIRKRFLLGLGLAGAAILLWQFRPTPISVQTLRVVRGDLQVTLDAEGKTRIHPLYVVAAPVAGRLAPVELNEGDTVKLGQTVARISPQPLDPRSRKQAEALLRSARASKSEADARVEEAAAALEQSRRNLERNERLAASGQVSSEELDRVRTAERTQAKALEAARFRSEAARCQAESARAALMESGEGASIPLCAPADGRVLRLHEDSERVVPAGAPILEVGDVSNLELVVDVLSTDAVDIPAGASMIVDAGAGRTFRGRVRLVEPAAFTKVSPLGVEEQRVNVVGDLDEPAPELGDRFKVEVSFVLWRGNNVLKIPSSALFRMGEYWGAFRVEGVRARKVRVGVGHRNSREAEILKGLAQGDAVVAYPPDSLEDGSRIVAQETKR